MSIINSGTTSKVPPDFVRENWEKNNPFSKIPYDNLDHFQIKVLIDLQYEWMSTNLKYYECSFYKDYRSERTLNLLANLLEDMTNNPLGVLALKVQKYKEFERCEQNEKRKQREIEQLKREQREQIKHRKHMRILHRSRKASRKAERLDNHGPIIEPIFDNINLCDFFDDGCIN